MIKLFLSLFLMVFASFILFIGLTQVVEVFVDNIGDSAKIEQHVSLSTFKLLDESVQNLTEQERKTYIDEYKSVFGPNTSKIKKYYKINLGKIR